MKGVEALRAPRRAATLLQHPMRTRILARAHEPISASALARSLEQPRQRVNYHVRQLASAGLLQAAGQHRRRNMVEQQYVASARAYILMPELLGDVALPLPAAEQTTSAEQLLALCAHAQSEIAGVIEAADAAGVRVRVLSLQSDIRFKSGEQRAQFARELLAAVSNVVARYTSTEQLAPGPGTGRAFRVLLGSYPVPGNMA